MSRFLAYFLPALLLFHTLGPEVLVLNYQLHKADIAARYCANKAQPQLRGSGKCHLAQQRRKAEGSEKKAPAATLAKAKVEVLPTAALALPAPHRWPRPGRRFARPWVAHCVAGRPLGCSARPRCWADFRGSIPRSWRRNAPFRCPRL